MPNLVLFAARTRKLTNREEFNLSINTKSAFVAVVGRPNVGKSSFVNAAVGQKVAIVSDKPQTTRTRIMGVCNKDEHQLVFVDTPGFHKPRNMLDKYMTKAAQNGLSDVEAAILVVEAVPKFKFDPENLPPAELELIEQFKKRKLPAILALNKIDLLEKKEEGDTFKVRGLDEEGQVHFMTEGLWKKY